ncbi:hypothetical protein AK830_g1576 [Neonectria ditissima]|uniref:Uncharacterized protein n=1 Tax=Neonectria ditissima TaxID=78410 RepID=A0A0P7BYK0_9HYPO|nr:hypothetical protein AK830_g1576 [Neonectria ditissima]
MPDDQSRRWILPSSLGKTKREGHGVEKGERELGKTPARSMRFALGVWCEENRSSLNIFRALSPTGKCHQPVQSTVPTSVTQEPATQEPATQELFAKDLAVEGPPQQTTANERPSFAAARAPSGNEDSVDTMPDYSNETQQKQSRLCWSMLGTDPQDVYIRQFPRHDVSDDKSDQATLLSELEAEAGFDAGLQPRIVCVFGGAREFLSPPLGFAVGLGRVDVLF